MNINSPEITRPPTQPEIDQRRCDILDEYLNPFAGDIYRSALTCFERFSALRNASLVISPTSNILSGGMNEDGELVIHVGTEESAVNPRVKSRVHERFGLPNDQDFPDGVYRLFILAHEIGHVIQKDPLFEKFYGTYDETVYDANKDFESYKSYVNSDNEVLADFIATQIISNSQLGEAMGMMPPAEEPHEWRQWGEKHRVDRTIEEYGGATYEIIHE